MLKHYDAQADIQGVTLQSMIRQPDYEILMGSKQDENFGPVILFGMGGIFYRSAPRTGLSVCRRSMFYLPAG